MDAFVCRTCGVQYPPAETPPPACPICQDERQYVGEGGQRWATLAELATESHRCQVRELEPGLLGIGVTPPFAIGQRALLACTPSGNLLWDPPGFLDGPAVEAVRERGTLAAVSASHPHFYGVLAEWSAAFGDAPILVPLADRQWFPRPGPAVWLWADRLRLVPGITLVQCGGHFPGSAVAHWAAGAAGRGALLTGDTISVVRDRRYVTFMRSYPNQIPLPERSVRTIVERVGTYRFDRIYGGWWDSVVDAGAAAAVRRSADRYVRWIRGEADPDR
ncbi:MAG TPA: MBL fold metallo-hydrolase [Frankiaceae bacterium]|nr:MBL fold metallo-hydrolase [Frankiaceae bacterium]